MNTQTRNMVVDEEAINALLPEGKNWNKLHAALSDAQGAGSGIGMFHRTKINSYTSKSLRSVDISVSSQGRKDVYRVRIFGGKARIFVGKVRSTEPRTCMQRLIKEELRIEVKSECRDRGEGEDVQRSIRGSSGKQECGCYQGKDTFYAARVADVTARAAVVNKPLSSDNMIVAIKVRISKTAKPESSNASDSNSDATVVPFAQSFGGNSYIDFSSDRAPAPGFDGKPHRDVLIKADSADPLDGNPVIDIVDEDIATNIQLCIAASIAFVLNIPGCYF
ncbi:unnamed protein product [Symbiodinium microadriaticum]|nr:unnamed protein product [Symbiodinium microadriaticum]